MHASALRIVGTFLVLVAAWKCLLDQDSPSRTARQPWGDWLFVGAAAFALYGLTLFETRRGAPRKTSTAQTSAQLLRAQRLESIGILAGGIAHDLNNVLTPILMAAKLLGKESGETERQGLLSILQTGAERGADLVRQLLSFAGGLEGEKRPLHLKHVIREVHALLVRTLPKSIQLQVSVAESLWQVAGDATQLSQVLMNLCINARDAMPDGGTLTIQADNAQVSERGARQHRDAVAGPYVAVVVADTGGGIPAEVMARIFDPFFTTKEFGHGTGLGLPTVLGIVKGHQGFVDIETAADRGTRFAVYLPALIAASHSLGPALAAEPCRGHGELVLVVDDEPAILDTARATLTAYGYQALTASDGHEAVAIYRQRAGEIRVILLDLMMPTLDGLGTLRELRALAATVPIVAMSGMPVEARVESAFAAGANLFLPKPFAGEQLVSMIEAALRSRPTSG